MKSSTFLAILFMATTATAQTTTTNSDCTIHSTGDNTASADCTSTTTTPKPPVPLDQDPSYKMGQQLGKGVGNLGAALIASHNNKKALKQFCEAHPGEPYRFTLPNGTVTSTGTCDGTMSAERIREVLIEGTKADAAKQGVLKFAEVKDDTYILHERIRASTHADNRPKICSVSKTGKHQNVCLHE